MEVFNWKKTNCQTTLALASVMCTIIFRGEYFWLFLDVCCGTAAVRLCDSVWRKEGGVTHGVGLHSKVFFSSSTKLLHVSLFLVEN